MLIYCTHCYSKAETKGGRQQIQESRTVDRMLKAAHLSTTSAKTTPDSSSESSSYLKVRTRRRRLMNDGEMAASLLFCGTVLQTKQAAEWITRERRCSGDGEKQHNTTVKVAPKVLREAEEICPNVQRQLGSYFHLKIGAR